MIVNNTRYQKLEWGSIGATDTCYLFESTQPGQFYHWVVYQQTLLSTGCYVHWFNIPHLGPISFIRRCKLSPQEIEYVVKEMWFGEMG